MNKTERNQTPSTTGAVIHAATGYDLLVWLLTFGRERAFREKMLGLTHLKAGAIATTRNSKFIRASQETIYRAFTDPSALAVWLPPGEMTGKIHSFDLRVADVLPWNSFSDEG